MANDSEFLENLISRCALRDHSALKVLYERTSRYLNAVVYRMLKSDDHARDVLQEVYIQIWQHADSYRADRAQPLTWMVGIARYRAIDRLNAERRLRQRELNNMDADDMQSDSVLEDTVETSDKQGHIDHCLSMLKKHVRLSIQLAYLEGYSREEIAHKFDTNSNTVKSWLRRGAERLKRCLQTKIENN